MKITVILFSLLLIPIGMAYADTVIVEIPIGTSVSGCEETNECYDPYLININVGDTIIWNNNDLVAHTVTSGNPTDGPDGVFDSGLIEPNNSFSQKFDQSQITAYFDMIHPWMQGIVRVTESDSNESEEKDSTIEKNTQDNSNFTEEEIVAKLSELSEVDELIGRYNSLVDRQVSQENGLTKISYQLYNSNDDAVVGYFTMWTNNNIVIKIKIETASDFQYSEESVMDTMWLFHEVLSRLIQEEEWEEYVGTTPLLWILDSINNNINPNEVTVADKKIAYELNYRKMQVTIDYQANSDRVEELQVPQTFSEKDSTIEKNTQTNVIKNAKLGLQEGDWVKYNIDVQISGGAMETFFEMAKGSMDLPELNCTFSDIEWLKVEVEKIENNKPVFQRTVFCNDNEVLVDDFGGGSSLYYIPTNVEKGDMVDDGTENPAIVEIEEREYGGKNLQVIKVHSETRETYENGSSVTTITSYFDKTSGLLLESKSNLTAENVPLFGDIEFSLQHLALDYNIPRSLSVGSEGGGCLIATAAYGSEMAPQIQFLREIRDGKVMSTGSGAAFMTGFNQFYYSFSPAIADYERENPVFKEMVRIGITPMLASLSILNHVIIDSEQELLGYGIGIILMNLGVYFVLPAVFLFVLKSHIQRR